MNNTCLQMAFFFEVFPSARDLVQLKCLDCSDATYHTPKSCFSSSPDHAHNSSPPAYYLVHTLGCASGCYHYSKVAHHSFTYKYIFTPNSPMSGWRSPNYAILSNLQAVLVLAIFNGNLVTSYAGPFFNACLYAF